MKMEEKKDKYEKGKTVLRRRNKTNKNNDNDEEKISTNK